MLGTWLGTNPAQAKTVVRVVSIGLTNNDLATVDSQVRANFGDLDYYAYDFALIRNPLVSADPVSGILAREVGVGQLSEIIIDVDGAVPDWATGPSIKASLSDHLGPSAIVHLEEADWYGTVGEEERRSRKLRSGVRLIQASISPNPDGTIDLDAQVWRSASGPPASIVRPQVAPRGEQYKYEDCTPDTISTVQRGREPMDVLACVHHRKGQDNAGRAQLVLQVRGSKPKSMGSMSKNELSATIAAEAQRVNSSSKGGRGAVWDRSKRSEVTEPKKVKTGPAVITSPLFGVQVGLPLIIGGSGIEVGWFRKRSKISAVGLRTEFNASSTTVDGTIGGIPVLAFAQIGDITNSPLVVGEGMIGLRYGGPDQGMRPQAGAGLRFPELFPGLFFTEDSGQGGPELFVRASVFSYSKLAYEEYWDDDFGYVQSDTGSTQQRLAAFVQVGIGWRWGR
jgi:hypothetical protein